MRLNCSWNELFKFSDFSLVEDQVDIEKYDEMLYGYKWKTSGKPFLKVERVSAERCSELHSSNMCDPVAAKEIRRKMKEEGRPIRSGNFLPGEDDIIVENLQNYHKDYPENNPLFMVHSRRSIIKGKRSIVESTLYYSRIAEGLNRTIYDVISRLKYVLFPGMHVTRKGKLSVDETHNLNEMYKKHGPRWKLISTKLGRNEKNLLAQWRHMQATKFGHWDCTEDNLLIESIKLHSDKVEGDLHNCLPWASIAKAVPGRNLVQCRNHWMFKLRHKVFQQEHHFDTLSWSNDQNMELITQICNQNVRFEEDVDFDAIRHYFEKDGFVVSNGQISKQWRQLKMKVNKYLIKSFEEILDEVSEMVVSQITDI